MELRILKGPLEATDARWVTEKSGGYTEVKINDTWYPRTLVYSPVTKSDELTRKLAPNYKDALNIIAECNHFERTVITPMFTGGVISLHEQFRIIKAAPDAYISDHHLDSLLRLARDRNTALLTLFLLTFAHIVTAKPAKTMIRFTGHLSADNEKTEHIFFIPHGTELVYEDVVMDAKQFTRHCANLTRIQTLTKENNHA